jgi:hypothetical protein
VNDEATNRTTDPDGREVVYDERARAHLESRRPDLIDQAEAILGAVSLPDHREDDREPGRERFYRQNILDPRRWLRVVVDYEESPARVVTALIQQHDPRLSR